MVLGVPIFKHFRISNNIARTWVLSVFSLHQLLSFLKNLYLVISKVLNKLHRLAGRSESSVFVHTIRCFFI